MKRSFNSTGRKKISLDLLGIRVYKQPDGRRYFSADLSKLANMGLSPDAEVFVEPYVGTSMMRYNFGTLGALTPPTDCPLDELDHGKPPLFRVKVVAHSQKAGQLLAMADRVQPGDSEQETEGRHFLLPLEECDLGEAIWGLSDLRSDARPRLQINQRIPDLGSRLATDPILQGAIFPVVVKEVMTAILFGTTDEELEWVTDWRAFASGLLKEPLPESPSEEQEEEVIESIVTSFVSGMRFATTAVPAEPIVESSYD